MNKKGILGNILGGFIMIFIAFAILPTIVQQASLITSCYNQSDSINISITQADTGSTDSFGGGGSEHFGGYTGEVKHKSFTEKVSEYSLIDSNSSIINQDCNMSYGLANNLASWLPALFIIGILTAVLGIFFSAFSNFRDVGLV